MSYDCRLQIDFLSLLVSENSYPSYELGLECSGKGRGTRSFCCRSCPLAIFLPVLQPVVLFQSGFLLYVHLKVRTFVQVIHLSNRLQRVTATFPSLFCFAQPKTNPPTNTRTMDPDDFDPATLQAILEIQLEDLESLGRGSKSKGREGAPPADFDVALDTLRAELAASASVLVDSAICRSMAIAVWRDRHALDEAEHDEDIARLDRELALRLFEEDGGGWMDVEEAMGSELGDNQDVGDLPGDLMDEQAIVRMPTPGNPDDDNTSTAGQPESSAWAQSRQPSTPPTPIEMAECVSCRVRYPTTDIARCPCSHRYCDLCLGELFQASMVDESLFPPRCCRQPIPVDDIRNFLGPKLVGQFLAKKLEYETPNRTYCHVPECSAFVPPDFVEADIAICFKCTAQTCAICKAATHEGECPQDEEAQAVLRLAEEKAWQRCSACRRVVELLQGCNHISKPPYPPQHLPLPKS